MIQFSALGVKHPDHVDAPSLQIQNICRAYNIYTTSSQRLRRWSNIVQMLYECFVFAGV